MTVHPPGAQAADRRRRLAEALRERQAAPAPLAPNQERLFVLQQLDPRSSAYAETVVLRLRGRLDPEALVSALRGLPARHEWLRSRIETTADGPVQVVDDRLSPVIVQAELPSDGGRDLDAGAREWVRALTEEPLPLTSGPVWRAGLARLAQDDHLLVLVVHHVACDAASLAVLLEEIGVRYDAELAGAPVRLPRPRSPRDLAREVRALQSAEPARHAVAAAAERLSGLDLTARIDVPGRRPAAGPGPARVCVRRVPRAVAGRVARTAAQLDATPFAVVGAAIGATLADALDADGVVLGLPVDLRWHLDAGEESVSYLVETAAIALRDVHDASLASATRTMRDAVAATLTQPPPFDELVAALRATGALPPTGRPLHAYVNWLDGSERPTLGDHGPAVTHVDLPIGEAKFDLSWTAVSRSGDLQLRLEYDSARVDDATAERLVAGVLRMLDVATLRPNTPVADLELLTDVELAQVRAWEGAALPPPDVDLFTHVAVGLAGATGPVLLAGEHSLTGPDLLAAAERLAAALRGAGVRPGDRVAVPSRRVPGMVVALLAVLRAGATFVPLDVTHPPARQADLARAARVTAVVGERGWAQRVAAGTGCVAVVTDDSGRPARAHRAAAEAPRRTADDLAYVMFTSGSTGRPKAVRVPDRAVVARIESYREVLAGSGVRHLAQSTLTFDASIYLFWALATGGSVVLPSDEQAADPVALVRLMTASEVTDAFFVPGLYEAVLRVARPGDLGHCRRLCIGGDVVPPSLAELHAAVLPQATFFNVYGPTEAVVTSSAAAISAGTAGAPLPIGRPHPGTVAQVLDRYGRRLPVGAVGELHLGGPCIADGYDDPEGPSPFAERARDGQALRWYATGDLARWRADGQLDYLGRRDRQVKLRGQRVELGEIEAALRSVPGVREAAVELVGSGDGRRLIGYVAPPVEGVRERLAAVLPAAWLPDHVVPRAALPRLASGKLDRAALRDAVPVTAARSAAGPAPKAGGRGSGMERTVLSIVRALLEDDRIGLDDDFFAVGGNSLLAARLMGQLSAMVGTTVPLHELLGHSTLREIAALTDRDLSRTTAESHEVARLIPVRERGSLPPLVLIARNGSTSLVLQHFLTRMQPERPLWVALRPMPPLGYRSPDLVADAREVARVLLERFPDGPLHLTGHSASGLVTLEAARALGDRRGATILLDTLAPHTWRTAPVHRAGDLGRLVTRRLRMYRDGVRAPRPGGEPPDGAATDALRLYQESVAGFRTRIDPVDFPFAVLTSSESQADVGREDLGWGRWASQVEFAPLDTDHLALLLQPVVTETVRAIDGILSRWR